MPMSSLQYQIIGKQVKKCIRPMTSPQRKIIDLNKLKNV